MEPEMPNSDLTVPTTVAPFQGGCACGAVRYVCDAEPLKMVNCHCRDCQRIGGGPYLPVVVVRRRAFRLTAGELMTYDTTRLSGRPNCRGFCPHCGSPVTLGEDERHDIVGITASSLDEPARFQPQADIFVGNAQPWDHMDPALPKFEHYLPRP